MNENGYVQVALGEAHEMRMPWCTTMAQPTLEIGEDEGVLELCIKMV
jgi:hypothetical protein